MHIEAVPIAGHFTDGLVDNEGAPESEPGNGSRARDDPRKRRLTELGKNGPEPFMGWVWPLIRMSKLEIADKCGNDAMIYVHFQARS